MLWFSAYLRRKSRCNKLLATQAGAGPRQHEQQHRQEATQAATQAGGNTGRRQHRQEQAPGSTSSSRLLAKPAVAASTSQQHLLCAQRTHRSGQIHLSPPCQQRKPCPGQKQATRSAHSLPDETWSLLRLLHKRLIYAHSIELHVVLGLDEAFRIFPCTKNRHAPSSWNRGILTTRGYTGRQAAKGE